MLPAILGMKCPRCRTGNLFENSNPFYLKKIGNMHKLCPVCGLNLRPEPGFYFGGAIVSYPMMVVFNLFVALIYYLVTGSLFDHFWILMLTLLLASLLVAPAAFRYSRVIFIYFTVKYDQNYSHDSITEYRRKPLKG